MLPGHYIQAADERGWDRLGNGKLLSAAEAAGFEVMITADQNLTYQQNLTGRKLSLIVLSTNRLRFIKEGLAAISEAIGACTPGSFHAVSLPQPPPRAPRPRI